MSTKNTPFLEPERIVTEAERRVMQEVIINEIFGFFQNKAAQFSSATQKNAYKVQPITSKKGAKVYRNPKLFNGEIYLDHTRLPPQKWSLFRSKSPVPVRGNVLVKAFNLIFIMGYSLDIGADIFYEIWFDSYSSSYSILDKYASPVSAKFKNLDTCVADFIDIISEENPTVHKGELSQKEIQILNNLARRNSLNLESVTRQDHAAEKILVEQLLEATGVTRQVLTQMLGQNVQEYHATRMNQVATKKFWQFWGKNVEVPQKYLSTGFTGFVQKIIGRAKTATFVIGFSLKTEINVEIWYVRDNARGSGSYYVFDLTSGEIVASNLKTVRDAYAKAASKLIIVHDYVGAIQ